MAANRPTQRAPQSLTRLSKTTLVDLVWDLAAVAPECASCDDAGEILRIISGGLLRVRAPIADSRTIERIRDYLKEHGA